MIDFMCLSC